MTLREKIRSKKRKFGLGEGVIEKLTPTPSEVTRIPKMDIITDTGIARGTAKGVKKGQWYSVSFPKEMQDPVVVAVAAGKSGEIIERDISRVSSPPSEWISKISDVNFSWKDVDFPGVYFNDIGTWRYVSRIERDDFNNDYYCGEVADAARDGAKDLSPPWPLSGLWDWFCDTFVYWTFFYGWKASGWIVNVLWDSFVQPQIDEVENEIEDVIGDINDQVNEVTDNMRNEINNTINTINNRINKRMGNTIDSMNNKVNNQVDEITDAANNVLSKNYDNVQSQIDDVQNRVNDRLGDLYEMWGIPKDKSIAVVHVRNVTKNGFEWLSLGDMKIYWIAIGDTEFERPERPRR